MISIELFEFISDFTEKRIKKNLTYDMLNCKTTLIELGIDDLDLDILLTQFVTKFNIDYSRFNNKLYFGLGVPLIDNNVYLIRKIIGNPNWLPLAKNELKPFTLGLMDTAISTGFLE